MKALRAVNKYFIKYKWLLLLGIIFVITSNIFGLYTPEYIRYSIDIISDNLTTYHLADGFSNQQKITTQFFYYILFFAVIILITSLIKGLLMFFMRQTIIVMSRHIEFDQKNEIFNHYQTLDSSFYKTHSTGDLMNRISEDVSRVRSYTGPAIMYFINLAATIGFSLYFMFRSDARLTLVALCPLPILAGTIYFVNTIINRKSEKIQAMLSHLTTNAQESFSGIRVIKSFVQEKNMASFFEQNSEAYRDNSLSLAKTEAIYFPSMGLLIGLSTLITILVGGYDVLNNVPGASIGKIAEFVMYIQLLTFPVSAIGWTASMTQRAVASQRRINEFLTTNPLIRNPENPVNPVIRGNITFHQANFTYQHTGIHAIKDFSLAIAAGQKIAIVGRTGSGKSTVAQLLLRQFDLQSGGLDIDGIPITEIDLDSLRKQISYVPQDVFLFSDSIKNNILFGNERASDEEVFRAAKQAVIYDEIMRFPAGFKTLVGERGVMLSGGQKQRISIARGLIKDPAFIIMDDCLSAVDAKTEKEITGNLAEYLRGKTAIIITHRIFSLLDFDKIVVLEEGRIVETGTHAELLSRGGYYAEMYRRQLLADENATA